jgi:porphobilinogen synthase
MLELEQIESAAFRSTYHMAIKFGRPIELRDAPRRQTALASTPLDLTIRPRRNRKAEWARRLVRENILTTDDLIWPLFVVDGDNTRTPVASMPGVDRLTVDQAVRDAERAAKLNIPCIALFPYTEPSLRDETGSEALNPNNLVCPTSACSATSRSTPSPATAMTGWSKMAGSSTTRRWRCW